MFFFYLMTARHAEWTDDLRRVGWKEGGAVIDDINSGSDTDNSDDGNGVVGLVSGGGGQQQSVI